MVNWCRLTSWTDKEGISWLQTPYYDVDGKLIGIQNRNLGKANLNKEASGKNDLGKANLNKEASGKSDLGKANPDKEASGKSIPRFRFPYGSQCGIYNLPVTRQLSPGEPL